MKKAVLLHGTDGSPKKIWFPWLKHQLEENGYEVFAPELPQNHTPNKIVYDKFLKNSGWDFANNILVGHSSGATTALNLLSSDWFPKVKATVLVGAFLNERLLKSVSPDWYDSRQFECLFKDEYDAGVLKVKGGKIYFVHGSDDPYCSIDDAKDLCNQVEGTFITIPNGGHLSASWNTTEVPQIIDQLKVDSVL